MNTKYKRKNTTRDKENDSRDLNDILSEMKMKSDEKWTLKFLNKFVDFDINDKPLKTVYIT